MNLSGRDELEDESIWTHLNRAYGDASSEASLEQGLRCLGHDRQSETQSTLEASLPPQLHPYGPLLIPRSADSSRAGRGTGDCFVDLLLQREDSWANRGNTEHMDSLGKRSTEPLFESGPTSSICSTLEQKNAESAVAEGFLRVNSSDLLHLDIVVNVCSFLDSESLASFSETARRPNYDCFYFLQLQLQRALLASEQSSCAVETSSEKPASGISGASAITRLASLDRPKAAEVVQDFLDSNSYLKKTRYSHGLDYVLQILRCSGMDDASIVFTALLLASFGTASLVCPNAAMGMKHVLPLGTDIPNLTVQAGFMGSLISAVCSLPELDPVLTARSFVRALIGKACGSHDKSVAEDSRTEDDTTLGPKETDIAPSGEKILQGVQPPRRCEKLPQLGSYEGDDKRLPSGCIGAYSQAVARARKLARQTIKERRRQKFLSLSEEEQRRVSSTFIDACCSDDSLETVRDIVQVQETIDVEGVYIGSEGIECSPLHTSAFHGSCKVLDYLCRGMDETNPSLDGGLCDVDSQDDNGWTALHYAAAAYSVDSVRVLVANGADLSVEAVNGCTPLQWAMRLQHEEVVEELRLWDRKELRKEESEEKSRLSWWMGHEPDLNDCESLLCAHSKSLKALFGRL